MPKRERSFPQATAGRQLNDTLAAERNFRSFIGRKGETLRRLEPVDLAGHRGCVNTVSFSPDGVLAITGSDDCKVKLWNVERGSCIASLTSGHSDNVFAAHALPLTDNNQIVTCAADGEVRLIVLSRRNSSVVGRHAGRAHRLALEPDSPSCFLSCGEDGVVRHYDLRCPPAGRGVVLKRPSRPSTLPPDAVQRSIYTIDINPRRPYEFYTGGDSPAVRILDLRRVSHDAPLLCAAASRGGSSGDVVTGLAVDKSGKDLVATLNDGPVYRFDIRAQAYDPRGGGSGADGGASAAGGSAGGGSGGGNGGVGSYSCGSAGSGGSNCDGSSSGGSSSGGDGTFLTQYEGHVNRRTVKRVDFWGPRSEYVISGSDCGHVFIWEKNGKLAQLLFGDSVGAVNCMASHPELPYLATSGLEHTARLWRPTKERPVSATALVGKDGQPASVIMARNGQREQHRVHHAMTRQERDALAAAVAAASAGGAAERQALIEVLRAAGVDALWDEEDSDDAGDEAALETDSD